MATIYRRKQETAHLWKWWKEWFKRLLLTSWHLVNRKAYRRWKANRQREQMMADNMLEEINFHMDADLFH